MSGTTQDSAAETSPTFGTLLPVDEAVWPTEEDISGVMR
jgi:hypothetical protein